MKVVRFIFTQAVAGFMSQVMQGSVSFDPSQIVLTCGATPAMEILSFCIADQGNAFLVPSPYYPGSLSLSVLYIYGFALAVTISFFLWVSFGSECKNFEIVWLI